MRDVDERKLVWTAPGTAGDLADLPRDVRAALEIAEIPGDPLGDPRLREVRVLIPPLVRNQADDANDLKILISSASRLDLVHALSAGVDSIVDLVPAEVTLCTVRGAYDDLMAELMLAGILAVYKEIPHHAGAQSRGRWEPRQVRVLGGARVLFVGYGSIAECLERYLTPFGVDVRRIARRPREGVDGISELSVLLPGADIVIVLTPLTAQTRGLIDEEFLTLMKPGALLVNGARGLIADTSALIAAAERGKVRAYLDVTDPEPLPEGHPLWSVPGVFITPHIGSFVPENRARAFEVVRGNLIRWARGTALLNVVTGDY
jgi:phosphoglycerate dehydrogenase-like enzyme